LIVLFDDFLDQNKIIYFWIIFISFFIIMLMHFLDIFLINRKQNTKKVILTMLERFIIEYENGMIDINEESYKDE